MLFSSYEFLFVFLPIVAAGYALLGRLNRRGPVVWWLSIVSLIYYGWWDWRYLGLIIPSMLTNFAIGKKLAENRSRALLVLGLAANLAVLGYFKYRNFFLDTAWELMGEGSLQLAPVILPLGISFFTFQKIGFLVDSMQGKTRDYNFVDYCLFVTFFPQLIAGPIVHHSQLVPQFAEKKVFRFQATDVAVGLTIFAFGFFKKVVLADSVAGYSNTVFNGAAAGHQPGLADAWLGAMAYTMQIYFDFSGYSDMAIGLARLFGIRLPLNFHSPYKSENISEFWRRWHMTLSRFLRDYLYIPLGGNRHGAASRYRNLMATMILGGLWHGAAWTFVVWGLLHGIYLCIHHTWRGLRGERSLGWIEVWGGRLVTFLAVVVAWVFFRASDFASAFHILKGAVARHEATHLIADRSVALSWIVALTLATWLLPNTQELMRRYRPAFDAATYLDMAAKLPRWRPTLPWAAATAGIVVVSVLLLSRKMDFIYYQF